MLPNIWIFDTYSICMLIGVIACLIVFDKYTSKIKMDKKLQTNIELLAIVSVILGIVFAVAFQSLFDFLKKDSENGPLAMTFFGGLVGGALCFLLGFFLFIKKKNKDTSLKDVLVIAPGCITIAHGFGRIGCFCAGCCHGIETSSVLGVTFPGMSHAVYPTQLFEASFLFILSAVLIFVAFKYNFNYTFSIYLAGYGVFRFLIEFIRGDDRGAFLLGLSPSQWFSIVAIILSIVYITIPLKIYKEKSSN